MKNFKKLLCVLLCFIICLSCVGCGDLFSQHQGDSNESITDDVENKKADDTTEMTNAMDSESVTENISESENVSYILSDDIYDFQIQIDNNVYQFPMKVSEVLSFGWEFNNDENPNKMIESNMYGSIMFDYENDVKAYFEVANFASSAQKVSDCYAVGIDVDDSYEWEIRKSDVVLAKNIKRGTATEKDIVTAYGSPTDTYEDEYCKQLTYETDLWQEINLEIDNKTKVLTDIDIQNIVKPENFVDTEISDAVPEYISNYKTPTKLGTDVKSGIVEIDNELYQFPIPVNALMDNGWELQTQASDESIPGKRYGMVKLSKNGKSLDAYDVQNYESYEIPIKYGAIEALTINDNAAGLVLPNDIYVGMSHAKLKSKLKGKDYKTEKSDYSIDYIFVISTWEDSDVADDYVRISVNIDKNVVSYIDISIENED